MKESLDELSSLFEEAKKRSEFDFILTLINYRGMGTKEEMSNLHEWFDAIDFYKRLYLEHSDQEKTRIGVLLYSTFFENSDFYNIIGSMCRVSLGFKGSSYLFYKTKKHERLLGTGEKIEMILELLTDCNKQGIISFFQEDHIKEIRNTFFHSAYTLNEEDYILQDSEPVYIDGIGTMSFNVETFLYPKIENVISFFDCFKKLYLDSFASYTENKVVEASFPNPTTATILGSDNGLKGFKIKNAVQFYGEWHDSGISYREDYDMWAGLNVTMNFQNIETIEIGEQLMRYESKDDITKNNAEFQNLIDKIHERKQIDETVRAVQLLIKFGNVRYQKMINEQNQYKKRSLPKIILPYYEQAVHLGAKIGDTKEIEQRVTELKKLQDSGES